MTRPGPMLISLSLESVTIIGFRQCSPLITIRRGYAEPVYSVLKIDCCNFNSFDDSCNVVTTKRSNMDMNVPYVPSCNSMIYIV